MAKVENMKGLQIFIKKIRAASTADERERIVNKEFAKIRACFGGSSKISSYDKKKSVWKLLYAHMMGYEVDFGHKQAADLIPSSKYDEKQVGYQALTILLNENDDFMTLLVNNVIKDLESNVEPFQALGLCFAGAVAGPEMAVAILQSVTKILMNERSSDAVRKKAALCLLRLFRKLPLDAGIITPDVWAPRLCDLLGHKGLGFKLSLMGLINGILERGATGYEALQPRIVATLKAVINPASVPKDYAYYGLPHPWLQVKCLRALTCFPAPTDAAVMRDLEQAVTTIVERHTATKVANLNNMQNAVLVEAVTLGLHLQLQPLLPKCVAKVTGFVQQKEPNARYVALETMSRLALVPEMTAAIKASLPQIFECLKEADVSIRKRAVDVLFMVCEMESVEVIVGALLQHVAVCDPLMKEDLVLKVAILAERFAPSVAWYIDNVLTLMDLGADEVNDDVWQRVVQLVTNNEDMQRHTSENVVQRLEKGTLSIPIINTAGYVLAEYTGTLQGSHNAKDIFILLKDRFITAPTTTRHLLLTAAVKLRVKFPDDEELKDAVEELLKANDRSQDAEMQQRATEYLMLSSMPAQAATVFEPMPPWPERESSLMRKLLVNDAPQDDDPNATKATLAEAAAAASERAASMKPTPAASPAAEAADKDAAAAAAASPRSQGAAGVSGALTSPKASPKAAPSQELPTSPPAPAPEPVVDLLNFGDDTPAAQPSGSTNPFDFLDGPVPDAPSAVPPPASAAPPAAPSAAPAAPSYNPFDMPLEPQPAQPAQPAAAPRSPPKHSENPFNAPPGMAEPTGSGLSAAHGASLGSAGLSQELHMVGLQAAAMPPPPVRVVPSSNPAWPRLLYEGRGILVEDNALQVGATTQMNGAQCLLTLFLGNKTVGTLENVLLNVPPTPGLLAAFQSECPPTIASQQQVQVGVVFTCQSGFSTPPDLQLSYSYGPHEVRHAAAMPIMPGKFAFPNNNISPPEFFGLWGAAPPGAKCAEMVRLPAPLAPEALARAMSMLGFSFGMQPIDPNPINFAGSTLLITAMQPPQQVITRVEMNPADTAHLQVTVVADTPDLATTFKSWIVDGLHHWSTN